MALKKLMDKLPALLFYDQPFECIVIPLNFGKCPYCKLAPNFLCKAEAVDARVTDQ